jgi:hypothetical protein
LALNLYLQVYQGEKYDTIDYCHHLAGLAFIQQAERDFGHALANYQKVIDLHLQYLSPYHPLESFDQDKLQYWTQLANEFEQNSTVK